MLFTFAFLAIITRIGAPKNAVIIPTSSSPGLPITLPITSEIVKSIAPPIADIGTMLFIFEPKIRRIVCGIISPTNPIGPAIAVVAPHNITPAIAHTSLTSPVFTPKPVATSSPNAKAFNAGVAIILIINPTTRNGSIDVIPSHVAPLTLPTCQNLYASIASARGSIIKLTRDDKIALTAEPDSASFIGVIPPGPIDDIQYTQIAVIADLQEQTIYIH